jgi:hypothetical protein
MKKPFFPNDKPKSFVVFLCAGSSALLICGPIMGLGIFFEANWLLNLGELGFLLCWVVGFGSGLVLSFGNWSGRYEKLEPREWKDQVW